MIVLSNRTYPDGRGDAQPLRKAILAQVSAPFGPVTPALDDEPPSTKINDGKRRSPIRVVDR